MTSKIVEYWEFLDPEKLNNWSLYMIPFKNLICFSYKYKVNDIYYLVSYDEKIKDIASHRANVIKVHCMMVQMKKQEAEQCHFTIILGSQKIPFAITHFLETLEPTKYRYEILELEKKINNNNFCTPTGKALSGRLLCTQLRSLFVTFEVLKAKMEMAKKDMSTRTVSQNLPSQGVEGRTSTRTSGTQSSRGTRRNLQS